MPSTRSSTPTQEGATSSIGWVSPPLSSRRCNTWATPRAATPLPRSRSQKNIDLDRDDIIVTVATDGSELYDAERAEYLAAQHPDGYDSVAAAADFGRELEAGDTAQHLELTEAERRRVFNLGYFTWVEQQGTSFDDFTARADQRFWDGMRHFVADWDELINEFNTRTGTRSDD